MGVLKDGSLLLRKKGKKCIFMFSIFDTKNLIKTEHLFHPVCLYESVGLATTNFVDVKLTITYIVVSN